MAGNPADSRKHKRKKKKSVKLLIVTAVIVVILLAAAFVFYKIKGPTHNMEDLEKYFFLKENPATGTSAAGEDELAIVLEDTMLDQISYSGDTAETQVSYVSRAFRTNGTVYLGLDLIYYNIDKRFYWDKTEQVLLVTNANDLISARLNENQYTVNGEAHPTDFPVVIEIGSNVYISVDFVNLYSHAVCKVLDNPRRVYISNMTGTKTYGEVHSDTPLRIRGGIRSNVVIDLKKGEKVQIISDEDDWLEVINEEGFLGYVLSRKVTNIHEEEVTSNYNEPPYTALSTGGKITMAWHSVYNTDANGNLSDLTANAAGLDVVSPTWYSIVYSDGAVVSRSSQSYVDEAHGKGYLVWAMLDIDSYEEGVSFYQLTARTMGATSARQKIIDTVMADVIDKNIDGINIDIETVNSDSSRDYIQFVRELSIRCRAAGKYLSVDNYTPYANNANIYHTEELGKICDYVIVMGYDDYIGGSTAGPNASLPFVRESVSYATALVDTSKLIYGIPFYTRFWYQTGTDGALTHEEYGYYKAVELLSSHGTPTWDETLGYNSLAYKNYETNVYVWLEDEQSIRVKCQVYSENGIPGVAAWTLGLECPAMWNAVAEFY